MVTEELVNPRLCFFAAHKRLAPFVMLWGTSPALQVLLQVHDDLLSILGHLYKLHTAISDTVEHFKGFSASRWDRSPTSHMRRVIQLRNDHQFRSSSTPTTIKQKTTACLQSSGTPSMCRHLKHLQILTQIQAKKVKGLYCQRALCRALCHR